MRRPFDVPPRAKEAGKLAGMLLLVLERARLWLPKHDANVEDLTPASEGL
jgi:hypothetical protein